MACQEGLEESHITHMTHMTDTFSERENKAESFFKKFSR